MSNDADRDAQRLKDLLAGKVLGDLSDAEFAEVEAGIADNAQQALLEDLEITAAAVQLAFTGAEEQLPAALRNRIRQQWSHPPANDLSTRSPRSLDKTGSLTSTNHDSSGHDKSGHFPSALAPRPTAARFTSRELVAWLVCAASVLITLGLWLPERASRPLALAEAREELQSDSGSIIAEWTSGSTPVEGEVTGDVVWNTNQQRGFMRFVGLPINNPTLEQYQLWIIDPGRDKEPIDGGVFDITSDGEVIIPIDAKLQVVSPQAFAITIEQPGGVVVSTQDKLPLLASVK